MRSRSVGALSEAGAHKPPMLISLFLCRAGSKLHCEAALEVAL